MRELFVSVSRAVVAPVVCLLIATSCAGDQASVAKLDLPVATVVEATPTPEPTVVPPAVAPLTTSDIDISSYPEPRYPSFVIPRDPVHEAAGIAAGESVSPEGIVVAIGYSTTSTVYQRYQTLISTEFTFVNAAAAGLDIERWASQDTTFERASDTIAESVGLDVATVDELVEVMFVQVAISGTANPRVPYVRALITETIRDATLHWPNLKQIYVYGREYGGWVTETAKDGTGIAGEPGTWANTIAVDGAIIDNFDRDDGVWVGQGPYLWANGDIPRADGLTWPQELFREDGRHLLPEGTAAQALMIHEFFLNDPTAPWYRADVTTE